MAKIRRRLLAALRLSKTEIYMLPPVLLGVAALAFFAFQIVGFLGIGLLGLLIGFIAGQVDLDKEGVIGPGVLHAQQMMARQHASSEAEEETVEEVLWHLACPLEGRSEVRLRARLRAAHSRLGPDRQCASIAGS